MTNTKEITSETRSKATAYTHGRMEILTKATTLMIFVKGTDRCTGMIIVITRGNGEEVLRKERASSIAQKQARIEVGSAIINSWKSTKINRRWRSSLSL